MTPLPEGQSDPRLDTLIIGGGQAGLAVGYHLAKRDRPFLILDAKARIGDAWRKRWDSLRVFTPARFDGLPGAPFPGPAHAFPSKDEVADYLEAYAAQVSRPVRTGVRVDWVSRLGDRFLVTAGEQRFEADNIVVAMGSYQNLWTPSFASELDPGIVQLHSSEYRNPTQLQDGGVLVVGAGNSGAEIALDVADTHPTWLSGPDRHQFPFDVDGAAARFVFRPLMFRFIGHRVLTVDTPIGRKMRPKLTAHAAPLVRTNPRTSPPPGLPEFPGRSARETASRCSRISGSSRSPTWSRAPGSGQLRLDHSPRIPGQRTDAVPAASSPASRDRYFVGLFLLYAMSSGFLPGIDRDAEHIATHIAAREPDARVVCSGP